MAKIKNTSQTNKKQKSHQVTKLDKNRYQVKSGTSGKAYIVGLGNKRTCNCRWGKFRKANEHCSCSHVQAVIAYIAKNQKGYTAKFVPNTENVDHLKRKVRDLGDGVQVVYRKVYA